MLDSKDDAINSYVCTTKTSWKHGEDGSTPNSVALFKVTWVSICPPSSRFSDCLSYKTRAHDQRTTTHCLTCGGSPWLVVTAGVWRTPALKSVSRRPTETKPRRVSEDLTLGAGTPTTDSGGRVNKRYTQKGSSVELSSSTRPVPSLSLPEGRSTSVCKRSPL